MRDLVELREFCERHRHDSSLVMCTLVRKSGSSYRGVGAKKLVASNGKSCGLLSGGCLEGSIEKSARERRSEMPFIESFSTLSDEDRLMGYQVGCQGVIDILFEQVPVTPNKLPDKLPDTRTATNWEMTLNLLLPFGSPAPASGVRVGLKGENCGRREFTSDSSPKKDEDFLIEPWVEPIQLLIIGCGADADVYPTLARSLGWKIKLIDYRSDLVSPERFPNEDIEHIPLNKMASHVPQGERVAVVLMTHNYEADLEIMRGLKDHRIGYLGALGPASRYEKIKQDLFSFDQAKLSPTIESVVSAPAGLFSHSRSPSEIALSIIAQIQERLVESPLRS